MRTRLKSEVLLRTALVTLTFFLLLRIGGAHTHVGVLSGTLAGGKTGLFFGLLYALSWLSVVLIVPPLILAGLSSVALGARGVKRTFTRPRPDSLTRRR